jgi:membrane protein YdbS with pleckstrin-like domain
MLEPGESIITRVRKSIVVLIGLYLEVLAGLGALVAVVAVTAPNTFSKLINGSDPLLMAAAILVVALVIFILTLVTMIYLQNQLLLTDRSLILLTQKGPFGNTASRLSFSNVEDVKSDQQGFLAMAFNYGTLLVQTAGAMDNFKFTYCVNPDRFAHQVLEARQAYAQAVQENPDELHP